MSDQRPQQQPQSQPAREETGRPLLALTDRTFAQQLLGFADNVDETVHGLRPQQGAAPRASRSEAIGSHREDFGQDIVGDLFGIKVTN